MLDGKRHINLYFYCSFRYIEFSFVKFRLLINMNEEEITEILLEQFLRANLT